MICQFKVCEIQLIRNTQRTSVFKYKSTYPFAPLQIFHYCPTLKYMDILGVVFLVGNVYCRP